MSESATLLDGDSLDLSWERDGRMWPNREASRFVTAGGLRWHVQVMGAGPCVLMVHGTGASSHSWRDLAPRLAQRFCVLAPDLPGHGFSTQGPAAVSTLKGMASALRALVATLDRMPVLAIGHSAGAALLVRMAIDGDLAAAGIVSLNGALLPFRGPGSQLFSPAARMLALNHVAPRLLAWYSGQPRMVRRMLGATGSKIDETGVDLYARLARSPRHVAGAIKMMAGWDLDSLRRDLPGLETPLLMVLGGRDAMVPPADSERVRTLVLDAELVAMEQHGHLVHEEDPDGVLDHVLRFAGELGIGDGQ